MTRVLRPMEWAYPVTPVEREILAATPTEAEADRPRPPVLFVPGLGHGAWAFAARWLEHAAGRGFPAYAMSLRGHGDSAAAPRTTIRAYTHDVTQVAARLPRQAVLVGHGTGALAVARTLARYPARAGVLVSPVFGGPGTALNALRRNPAGTLPALFGGRLRLRRGQLFGRELTTSAAREFAAQVKTPAAPLAQWQLLAGPSVEDPVGDPPVLVVGSPDDRVVPRRALERAARRYGAAPLLFPGMGHDMMLDARWQEPIDAILDWIDKSL
ncbi:alpha/beta fold hydrolase [Luedemannella helvata]|uniref:Alpha/beta fold hydrolase n=2 Tax=Luedemannella helvata TaxID=349315 RepID=A0ABN2JYZ1_9ACTN